MKNQKIEDQFKAVLEKAVANGWDTCGFLNKANCDHWQDGIHQWQNVVDLEIYFHGHKRIIQADTIWFDHDFAKAFFGEKQVKLHDSFLEQEWGGGPKEYDDACPTTSNWRNGLSELVYITRDERLAYLFSILHEATNDEECRCETCTSQDSRGGE